VLARGFGTSESTEDVAPPRAAPRPRVAGGVETPLTFAQVLARGFGAFAHAVDATTPPAAPPAGLSGPF